MNAFTLFGDLKVGTTSFENSLYEAEARLNQTQRAIHDTEKSAERLGRSNAQTARTFEKLNDSVKENRERMRSAVDAYEKGEISASKLSTVLRQTDSRVNGLNSRLKDTKARMADAARGVSSFGSIFKQVFAANIFAGGVEGFSRMTVDFAKDSVKLFATLDKLVRFTATLDKNFQSPEALQAFRTDIQKLSTEIPHSAESIAKASFQIKSAFSELTRPELIEYLREFGNAATASNTDIATHSFNMAALAKQYNITAGDLRSFSAIMTTAFGAALATDEKVAQGFNRILSAAQSTRQPLSDMAAAMSVLQSVSSDAEQNTTLLLNVYSKLTDPKYIEGLKAIGVSVFDAAGNFKPLNQLINELAKELEGLNDQQVTDKLEFAKDLQAREGLKILIRQIKEYNKTLSDGTDQEAFARKNEQMLNSADAKWERFTNKINNIKIEIGAAIADMVDTGNELRLNPPKFDTAGWTDVLLTGIEAAILGAGRAGQPVAAKGGISIGTSIVDGMVTGMTGGLGAVMFAASRLAAAARDAAKDVLWSQSPSRVFMEIGRDVGAGFVIGIDSKRGAVKESIESAISLSAVKKRVSQDIKEMKKELREAMLDFAAFTAGYEKTRGLRRQRFETEQASDTFNELIEKRFEMRVNVDAPLPTLKDAEEEIRQLDRLKEGVQELVDRIKDLGEQEPTTSSILKLFANKQAAEELKKQAEALGLTVEEFRKLSLIVAPMSESLKSLGLGADAPLRSAGLETSGLSTSAKAKEGPLVLVPPIELPPPLIAPWENFWATMKDHLNSFKSSLPSIKQSIGENVINSLYGIGDVLGSAVANADGTLRGFFQNVGQGFQRMAQQIIGELLRIAVYQLVLQLFGSVAGAGAGSATRGASAGYYSAKNLIRGFDAGGFTGTGSPKDVAGFVHKREFVMPWEAVKAFGLPFMESIKNLQMPRLAFAGGFDMGGFTGGSAREAFAPDLSQLSSSMRSGQTASTEGGGQTVNHFHFHSRQDGSFSRQSAEQAARAMIAAQNRVVTKSG